MLKESIEFNAQSGQEKFDATCVEQNTIVILFAFLELQNLSFVEFLRLVHITDTNKHRHICAHAHLRALTWTPASTHAHTLAPAPMHAACALAYICMHMRTGMHACMEARIHALAHPYAGCKGQCPKTTSFAQELHDLGPDRTF